MTTREFNDLIDRIRDGDGAALEPIYKEYYRQMVAQASYIVGRADGEDVASEAMIKLMRYARSDGFKPVSDAGAFLYTTVRNASLDFLRKRSVAVELDYIESLPADTPGEDGNITRLVVRDALLQLDEPDRKIAVMFYFYDSKIKTIAAELGMNVSTVKWHLSKIREKLYKIIQNR